MLSLLTKFAVLATVAMAAAPAEPLPSGALTPKFVAQIHAAGSRNKCLHVAGNVESGTPIQVGDCIGGGFSNPPFEINGGLTEIRVAGSNYCVDVGNAPLNNGNQVKIWNCHGGYQQQFDYTRDGRIRVRGQNICLDVTDGKLENGNPIQIYSCGDSDNDNQWFPAENLVQPRK